MTSWLETTKTILLLGDMRLTILYPKLKYKMTYKVNQRKICKKLKTNKGIVWTQKILSSKKKISLLFKGSVTGASLFNFTSRIKVGVITEETSKSF